MCLTNVSKKDGDIDQSEYREAWKVFTKNIIFKDNALYGWYRSTKFIRRRWTHDEVDGLIQATNGMYYRNGFHCFLNREEAMEVSGHFGVVHRVLVKDVVAVGTQVETNVIVARSIYIMEEVDNENY